MKPCVVIDPGHGGADTGCRHALLLEKDIVLDVAIQVVALAGACPDLPFTVQLTRTDDRNLGLQEAADIAKSLGASMVIALHCDSLPSVPRARGLWCAYAAGETLTPGSKARAEVFLNHVPHALRGRKGALVEATNAPGAEDDWLKRARNVLLPHMKVCPAFLVESGFISNDHDRKFLASPAGRAEYAACILAALCEMYHA